MFTRRRLTGAAVVAGTLAFCVGAPLVALAGLTFNATIAKTHQGNFTVGSNGTFTLTLSDSSSAAGADTFSVTDSLPTGLSYVSAGGPSFSCSNAAQVVTCTGNPSFTATGQTATITVVVGVGASASPSVVNTASFTDGAGADGVASDNTASDTVTVNAAATTTTTTTSSSSASVSPTSTSTIAPPAAGASPAGGAAGGGVLVALLATGGVVGSALGASALRRRR